MTKNARTCLLLVAALVALPAASAQLLDAPSQEVLPPAAVSPQDTLAPLESLLEQAGEVVRVDGTIQATGGVAVTARATVAARPPAASSSPEPVPTARAATSPPAPDAGLPTDASTGAGAVAGSALIGLLLAALALGIDGVRALPGRIASFASRFGRAMLGFILPLALFSRLQRGSLLDNPVRARIHDAIAQEPGLSLTQLSARAGIAWGTAVHHVRRLETHGLVVSTNQLAHRRLFIANTVAAEQRVAVAVVLHPTARRIANLVRDRPGIDQTAICQTLGLNNPAASKHLSAFEAKGLIVSQRAGRSRQYQATGGLHAALQLLAPQLEATVVRMPLPRSVATLGACPS